MLYIESTALCRKFEVGMFFDGVGPDQHDKLREISPGYPVFRISLARDQARG